MELQPASGRRIAKLVPMPVGFSKGRGLLTCQSSNPLMASEFLKAFLLPLSAAGFAGPWNNLSDVPVTTETCRRPIWRNSTASLGCQRSNC